MDRPDKSCSGWTDIKKWQAAEEPHVAHMFVIFIISVNSMLPSVKSYFYDFTLLDLISTIIYLIKTTFFF